MGALNVNLLLELEQTRALMIHSGMKYGFQHENTLLLSKKLDALMNEYELRRMDERVREKHKKNFINIF